jgi:Flp pilus assembly protein TadG
MSAFGSHRGSTTLEVVVVAPALLALAALVIGAGRVALAGQTVQTAAAQAARDATLERSPSAGSATARATAARVLREQDLACTTTSVDVDARDLAQPVGQSGEVTVEVACRVRLSDLAVPGLPGAKVLRATATMPTDPWTARP